MKPAPTISSISFAGLRRLNPFDIESDNLATALDHWQRNRTVYKMGQVNVFVGRNGGGKSTVLDLVDQLRNPDRICNLPRENRTRFSYCFWDLTLSTGARVLGTAAPNEWSNLANDSNLGNPLDTQALIIQVLPARASQSIQFRKNISKRELSPQSRSELDALFKQLSTNVAYWSRDDTISPAQMVEALNQIAPLLSGLISDPTSPQPASAWPDGLEVRNKKPILDLECGRIALYLSDDDTQFNNVHVEALPSGWRQIASLLTFVQNCPRGSICILEEPDAHLHASLQRALVRRLAEAVRERNLQLFISTHSLTVQSKLTWPGDIDARFFEVDANRMYEGVRTRQLLDDLGINGSDQGTSNGVVWVEGPSDRIYVKHWLKLFCDTKDRTEPVEHVDYMFSYHGGALLSHLTAEDAESTLVDIARLNRNFVVIMDDDGDFDVAAESAASTGAPGKQRMLERIAAIGSQNCCGLSTPGYTIEASLPAVYRNRYFKFNELGKLRHFAGKKVAVARRYVQTYLQWSDCFDHQFSIVPMMTALVEKIDQWNRTADPATVCLKSEKPGQPSAANSAADRPTTRLA
jgi:hypothetical protein